MNLPSVATLTRDPMAVVDLDLPDGGAVSAAITRLEEVPADQRGTAWFDAADILAQVAVGYDEEETLESS